MMNIFKQKALPLLIASLNASVASHAFAQNSPPASAGTLPDITITSNPLGGTERDQITPVTNLRGTELELKKQNTLGDTLRNEVGVSSTGFGPNASRPIIRGQDGDRIKILSNGSALFDASAVSADHAVALNPIFADRVEVVRGSAALRFGGTAIGGVVNVLDERVPLNVSNGISGEARVAARTSTREDTVAAKLNAASDNFAITADGFRVSSGDVKIPGFARSSNERNATNPRFSFTPGTQEPQGVLLNSNARTEGGSVGVANRGAWGAVGLSVQTLRNNYGVGVFSEPDARIGLNQDRAELQGKINTGGFFDQLSFTATQGRYRHTEFEAGEPDTTFRNQGKEVRIEGRQRPSPTSFGIINGVVGVQASRFEFDAVDSQGANSFLPNTRTRTAALYTTQGLSARVADLSVGLRHENNTVSADDSVATLGCNAGANRSFGLNSANIGTRIPVSSLAGVSASRSLGHAFTAQLSHSERAPTYQELFACGEHAATLANEYGDPSLQKERANALEFGWVYADDRNDARINVYQQRFSNYIGLLSDQNTVGLADPTIDTSLRGNRGADGNGNFFIDYLYASTRAQFTGLEAQWKVNLTKLSMGGYQPALEFRFDRVQAKDLNSGEPLPRIAPARVGTSGILKFPKGQARLDVNYYARQNRLAAGETSTDGYTLLNAYASYRMYSGQGGVADVFLRGNNLLNTQARDHSSFLKEVLPLAGRSLTVGLKYIF